MVLLDDLAGGGQAAGGETRFRHALVEAGDDLADATGGIATESTNAGLADARRSRAIAIAIEDAGQQELLNWCPLLGAMQELGARLDWSDFVETHVFNSNKVFAAYHPA